MNKSGLDVTDRSPSWSGIVKTSGIDGKMAGWVYCIARVALDCRSDSNWADLPD